MGGACSGEHEEEGRRTWVYTWNGNGFLFTRLLFLSGLLAAGEEAGGVELVRDNCSLAVSEASLTISSLRFLLFAGE